jgi:NADH-quinone oxidoreductase subunit H
VSIFFGGWRLGQTADTFLLEHLPNFAFALVTLVIWTIKVFVFCAFQLLVRWSLPRFRSDQLMRLGWQRLLPVSIANVVITAFVILFR